MSGYEAVTGKDMITTEKLSTVERIISGIGAIVIPAKVVSKVLNR